MIREEPSDALRDLALASEIVNDNAVTDAARATLVRFDEMDMRVRLLEGVPPFIRLTPDTPITTAVPGDIQWVDHAEEELRSRGFVRRMLGYHTSPLEREILAWYYCRNEMPFLGGSEHWTPVHLRAVGRMTDLGLLIKVPAKAGQTHGHIEANKAALRVYMEALASVPLPVQRWVTPSEEP